jgi:hypothetical protein
VNDPQLRRIERTAAVACLVMAAAGWLLAGPGAALGVLGGGLLSAVSYGSLSSGVSALTAALERAATPAPREPAPEEGTETAADAQKTARPAAGALLKVVLRYALLTLLAYVMIARLRLHPVGVLAGVSSVVAAIAIEAVRILLKKS